MAKAAQTRAVGALHRLSRTIAMPDLPIGWRVGLCPRRLGAVPTKGKVALQRLEDVLELELDVKEVRTMAWPRCHLPRCGYDLPIGECLPPC